MFDVGNKTGLGSQGHRWLIRSLTVWLALMAAETLNGTIRVLLIVPIMGDPRARQLSMAVAMAAIFLITLASVKWIGVSTTYHLITIGAIWSALTVIFEFTIAAAVTGRPWESFKRDYDITTGGLMPFGLVFLLLAPLAAAQVRKWRSDRP